MTTATKKWRERLRTCLWPVKPIGMGTYPQAYVKFTESYKIEIQIFNAKDDTGYSITLSRPFARLLARRINEALDAWAGKGKKWWL